ncbi:MAG: HAD family hydrolase [Candidatus Aminicenantes bacterium]|nr:HAD family hydrolase [Candidatus Aminicenantes bacterium]
MKKIAVFLDRDGNINEDVGYPNSYDKIKIYPYSFEAVRKINHAGLLAVIVTNQSGIGRGLIEEKNLLDIHNKMKKEFELNNAHIDGVYFCPHFTSSPDPRYRADCDCAKPNPGMALKAAADLNINLKGSYVVGDKVSDIAFGYNIQARPVLVLTGYGKDSLPQLQKTDMPPAHISQNLLEAVEWIIEQENRRLSQK